MTGIEEGSARADGFDPAFYAAVHPDLAGIDDLFAHYTHFGAREGRYASRAALERDARKLRASRLYEREALVRFQRFAPIDGLSDTEAYLLQARNDPPIGKRFDAAYYRACFEDSRDRGIAAALHYLEIGLDEARVTTYDDFYARRVAIESSFDAAHYLAQFETEERPADPLEHYILHGERLGYEPAPNFSPDYYLRRYDDVAAALFSSFAHFLNHGGAEGRCGKPAYALVAGGASRDWAKPTLILVHGGDDELTPFAASLAGVLAERWNVLGIVSAPPSSAFERACAAIVSLPPNELDAEYVMRELRRSHGARAVVLDSARLRPFAKGALHAELPCVALVNEFPEYVEPDDGLLTAVEHADRAIASCAAVRTSVERETEKRRGRRTQALATIPPAVLAATSEAESALSLADLDESLAPGSGLRPAIVLGAGRADDMRGGLDLFVRAAALLRRRIATDVRFVWVGADYRPKTDVAYGFWVGDAIAKLGLGDCLRVVGQRDALAPLVRAANVYVHAARLDGYPRGALEAVAAGCRVVAFAGVSALDEVAAAQPERVRLVPFADVVALAEATAEALRATPGTADAAAFRDERRIERYATALEVEIAAATAARAETNAFAERLLAGGDFDAKFHDGVLRGTVHGARRRAAATFAARATKGLAAFNPRPGCEAPAALAASRDGAALPATHRAIDLDALPLKPSRARVALHLHLDDPERARDVRERIDRASVPLDVFVSVTTPEAVIVARRAFVEYGNGSAAVVEVAEREGDLAPLFVDFAAALQRGGYDVIGHLHRTRGSAEGVLFDDAVFGRVVSLFDSERDLGLLFAEERRCGFWEAHRERAARLASELVPVPALPNDPIFPKDANFWSRPEALLPLWNRRFVASDFSSQSRPENGSLQGAIARMLPSVAESAGLHWCTVYRT